MRLCSTVSVLLGLIVTVCATEVRADDSSDSNSSNNPVEPKLTLEYWNYFATSLNQLSGYAENGTHPTSAVLSDAWYFAKRVTLSLALRS